MRKPIIAGNWKMNMTPAEAEALVSALLPLVRDAACEVVVCPPFVDLYAVSRLVAGTNVRLGAQNVHWAAKGAFTGEISADMLSAFGVGYAIIGHSERRQYFGETDEGVNARAKAALAAGITPIICVGETLEQRESGVTDAFVSAQAKAALAGMEMEQAASVVIAYEPIWAIGTGNTATPEQAGEVCAAIRGVLRKLYGARIARSTTIQYGGSMNAANAQDLLNQEDVDGGLIGTAALDVEQFLQIIQTANQDGPQP